MSGPDLYFGGAFNPPHVAHVRCALAAAKAAGLGRVVLVPTGQPTLKTTADVVPASDRLEMVRLAAAEAGDGVRVDDREVRRAGTTYTVDTAEALAAEGVSPVNWLIGADQLLNLHRWHRFEDLLRRVRFRVMARPGYAIDWSAVSPAVRPLAADVVTVPQIDVSATEIRRRLHAGEPVAGLLSPTVEAYVRAHGLYGTNG